MFRDKDIPKHQRLIEEELVRVLSVLPQHQADTTEYGALLSSVERIHKLMEINRPLTVSRDTLATVAANLVGILLIIKHEDVNVITSKALGFIIKLR